MPYTMPISIWFQRGNRPSLAAEEETTFPQLLNTLGDAIARELRRPGWNEGFADEPLTLEATTPAGYQFPESLRDLIGPERMKVVANANTQVSIHDILRVYAILVNHIIKRSKDVGFTPLDTDVTQKLAADKIKKPKVHVRENSLSIVDLPDHSDCSTKLLLRDPAHSIERGILSGCEDLELLIQHFSGIRFTNHRATTLRIINVLILALDASTSYLEHGDAPDAQLIGFDEMQAKHLEPAFHALQPTPAAAADIDRAVTTQLAPVVERMVDLTGRVENLERRVQLLEDQLGTLADRWRELDSFVHTHTMTREEFHDVFDLEARRLHEGLDTLAQQLREQIVARSADAVIDTRVKRLAIRTDALIWLFGTYIAYNETQKKIFEQENHLGWKAWSAIAFVFASIETGLLTPALKFISDAPKLDDLQITISPTLPIAAQTALKALANKVSEAVTNLNSTATAVRYASIVGAVTGSTLSAVTISLVLYMILSKRQEGKARTLAQEFSDCLLRYAFAKLARENQELAVAIFEIISGKEIQLAPDTLLRGASMVLPTESGWIKGSLTKQLRRTLVAGAAIPEKFKGFIEKDALLSGFFSSAAPADGVAPERFPKIDPMRTVDREGNPLALTDTSGRPLADDTGRPTIFDHLDQSLVVNEIVALVAENEPPETLSRVILAIRPDSRSAIIAVVNENELVISKLLTTLYGTSDHALRYAPACQAVLLALMTPPAPVVVPDSVIVHVSNVSDVVAELCKAPIHNPGFLIEDLMAIIPEKDHLPALAADAAPPAIAACNEAIITALMREFFQYFEQISAEETTGLEAVIAALYNKLNGLAVTAPLTGFEYAMSIIFQRYLNPQGQSAKILSLCVQEYSGRAAAAQIIPALVRAYDGAVTAAGAAEHIAQIRAEAATTYIAQTLAISLVNEAPLVVAVPDRDRVAIHNTILMRYLNLDISSPKQITAAVERLTLVDVEIEASATKLHPPIRDISRLFMTTRDNPTALTTICSARLMLFRLVNDAAYGSQRTILALRAAETRIIEESAVDSLNAEVWGDGYRVIAEHEAAHLVASHFIKTIIPSLDPELIYQALVFLNREHLHMSGHEPDFSVMRYLLPLPRTEESMLHFETLMQAIATHNHIHPMSQRSMVARVVTTAREITESSRLLPPPQHHRMDLEAQPNYLPQDDDNLRLAARICLSITADFVHHPDSSLEDQVTARLFPILPILQKIGLDIDNTSGGRAIHATCCDMLSPGRSELQRTPPPPPAAPPPHRADHDAPASVL